MRIDDDTFPVADDRRSRLKRELYLQTDDSRAKDRYFHHRIRVPKRCEVAPMPIETPTDDQPVTHIAWYRSNEGPELTVSVRASILRREVAPADWLEQYLAVGGFDILGSRRLPGRAGQQADILTSDGSGADKHISRWRAIKSGGVPGGRILFVQARTPETAYRDTAIDLYHPIISLDWLNPGNFPFAENIKTYSKPSPGDFLIHYPASWECRETLVPGPGSDQRITDLYHMKGDTPQGRITFISSRAGVGHDALLDSFLASLSRRACVPRMGPIQEAPVFGDLERAWSCEGTGHGRRERSGRPAPLDSLPRDPSSDPLVSEAPDMSITVRIGQREDVHYLIGMISRRKEDDRTAYALNQRAFEIVHRLMRTESVS